MAMPIRSRTGLIVAIVAAVLVLGGLGGLYAIQREIKQRVAEALAPIGSASRIDISFWLTSVELRDVHLKAPHGWPTTDSLRAGRITVTTDPRAFLQHRIHIRDVTVHDFVMVVVRNADGSIQILPNLRDAVASAAPAPVADTSSHPGLPRENVIDRVAFENGSFEFYDRSVSDPPHRVTLSDAKATVGPIHLPALADRTQVAVTGEIKGPQHTGQVSFSGWVKIASEDSQTTTTLRGVDVATLAPYLIRKPGARTQIAGGTLDLDITATVSAFHVHAPGTITLRQLQLARPAQGHEALDTFLAIPTHIAIDALKAHNGDITLHFVLDGDLHDPKFKLDESLMTEVRAGFAKALGVSAEDVVKGAGETAKGIGEALRRLLGGGQPSK
ncbi:DUF748 domain-containing protein [Paraburkholderia dinghuensis]|uniref:DUF748 domain-containing protein n=1 Tax=Paraburkholderia dinghuensis TaxID=2305225 RepID=A0A3N6N2A7_9BURK|nr:DUF748 domain-containing protein [Paraburkholderia dinghuensis]RQH02982.1 DUF748 domain-containing protein [Paraburkholderia dinghuensis]